jgi:hypothetical protein
LLRRLRSGFQNGRTGRHPCARVPAVAARRRSLQVRLEALEERMLLNSSNQLSLTQIATVYQTSGSSFPNLAASIQVVNTVFNARSFTNQVIDAPNIGAGNLISTAPGSFNNGFVSGSSDTDGRGVVSVTSTERLTMGRLRAVAAVVERTAMNLARTHNLSRASTRLTDLASEIPDGLQQLAPVWRHDLASHNPQTPGSGRAFRRQLLADLKHDVAAGVAAGEFRLIGPGAAAYLRSAVLPQASLDSVTIFNSTGFGITVSASLNGTGRTLPPRTIANSTSSLFDFGSSTNNFISINVSRTGSSQPPPFTNVILNRPISGYSGKQFTVSVFGGRFSVSV